jgi:hypothetical protein
VDGANPARPASRWAAFECRSGRCFRRTRWIPVEWVILHTLWAAGLGLVCPGRGSSAPFRHRLPRYATSLPRAGGEGEMSQLDAGPGRGAYVSPVDPQHGHDVHCGGRRCCTHRTIAPQKSGTPPAAGVSWWIHGVPCFPMRLLRKRAALSPSRSADSAGWVHVGGLGWYALGMERPVVCRAGARNTRHAHPSAASLRDLAACKPTETRRCLSFVD